MTCKVYMGSGLLISVQNQKALCTCNIFLRIMSSAFVLLKCKRCFFLLCTNVFIFRFKDNILLQCWTRCMDRRSKNLFFLVNLYRFCFIRTNFRNNFKYLSGHSLSLDTFELKLTIKKTFFYENVTEHSCKYVQTRVHKLHRLQPYILQDNINDGFFLSIANLY